ncbi:MAG: DUF494 family protein [Candidatus Wallbacteria bacterium]|nr:DUF494 family protein [Candidatus Wallbacteria bacterium]
MGKLFEIISHILKMISEFKLDPLEDKEQVIQELTRSGFDASTVEAALQFFFSSHSFLPHLNENRGKNTVRLFHPRESANLTIQAQGLLVDLFVNGYLTITELEEVMTVIADCCETLDITELLELLEQIIGYQGDSRGTESQPVSFFLN